MSPLRTSLLVPAVALVAACASDSVSMPSGSHAQMVVSNARFVMGAFPVAGDSDGGVEPDPDAGAGDGDASADLPPPLVHSIDSPNNNIWQGQRGKTLSGRVSFNAMTVAVGMEGDLGYWVFPVGATDLDNPPDLDFSLAADFAEDLPLGTHRVFVAAADARGRFGARSSIDLNATENLPTGDLVVALTWDRDADLDLFVVRPDGNIVSFRGVRTPTGQRVTPSDGSRVDLDSNANCVIDGQRQENAVFPTAMSGSYQVYVKMFAACGVPETSWRVRVVARGTPVPGAEVVGSSYASEVDTQSATSLGRRVYSFTLAE